VDVILSL